jgi:hypothetical protein
MLAAVAVQIIVLVRLALEVQAGVVLGVLMLQIQPLALLILVVEAALVVTAARRCPVALEVLA